MFAALLANQRSHATDRDQSVAYAAAHAGLEKLTASLAGLFATDFSPSADAARRDRQHAADHCRLRVHRAGRRCRLRLPDHLHAGSGPGANTGNPLAFPSTDITTGPFEGFKGLVTPYTITVTARSTTGHSEVRLRRELQTVAVPVFQFGVFGEKSLGFHAGPNFDFGGRVHTNERLYLASGDGSTLTFRDKITAFIEVVRNRISNGQLISRHQPRRHGVDSDGHRRRAGDLSEPARDREQRHDRVAVGRLEEPLGSDLSHQHPHRGDRRQACSTCRWRRRARRRST